MNISPPSDAPSFADSVFVPMEETTPPTMPEPQGEPWKILMVDDDVDIHLITLAVLKKIVFQHRGVQFLSAYSSSQAKELLKLHKDIAVILLDVVMETEHAGLELVHYIRETLTNTLARIILRTGHPGTVPERSVILEYDINDYREKTDLTATRLFTSVVAALRAYADIRALELSRRRMQCLAETASHLHTARSHGEICRMALSRIVELWNLCTTAGQPCFSGFAARKEGGFFRILAAVGTWRETLGHNMAIAIGEEDHHQALSLVGNTAPVITKHMVGYWTRIPDLAEFLIYLRMDKEMPLPDEESFHILFNSIGSAFEHLVLDQEIKDTQGEVILTICEVVETRSRETGNHVRRVGELSALLATLWGLPEREVELLRLSASLHDLGKIGIADHILNKPGRFTPEEFAMMQAHCHLGHRILCHSRRDFLRDAALVALQHHEKWNGQGYPAGLTGKEIHPHGRIVAVADVFDALRNERPYKKAWPMEQVVDYFRQQRGEHFDPQLVDLLLANLDAFVAIQNQFPE